MKRSRLLLAVLVGAGALAARSGAGAEPVAAIPLWLAVKDGRVSVVGKSTGGYSQAQLEIRNRTTDSLVVDVNGSYLAPTTSGSAQRLGLGLLTRGSRVTEVPLARGGTATVKVLSVCMDHSRPSPNATTAFALAREEAPGRAGAILKRWKEHPAVDPCRIQGDVWGIPRHRKGRPEDPRPIPVDLPEGTSAVAVLGGTVFALVPPGQLVRARPGEVLAPVGLDAVSLLAQDGFVHAVFRTAPAAVTSGTHERRPCVARFDGEGGIHWTEELTLPAPGPLRWARDGAAIVELGKKLVLVRGSGGSSRFACKDLGPVCGLVVPVSDGALVLFGAGRLVRVRASDAGVEVLPPVELGADLTSVALGSDRLVYGTTERGTLLRLGAAGRLERVQHLVNPTDSELRTGAPERKVLSVRPHPEGLLLSLPDGLHVLRGSALEAVPAPPGGAELTLDGRTGRFWAWRGTGLHELDGDWQQRRFVFLPPPPVPSPYDVDEDELADAAAVGSGTAAEVR